jgi:NIPSNAP
MRYQLRMYTLRSGKAEEFVQLWREQLAPLRREHGFEVVGGWVSEDEERFVWIIGHDGDFERAEAEYHADRERIDVSAMPQLIDRNKSQRSFMRGVL